MAFSPCWFTDNGKALPNGPLFSESVAPDDYPPCGGVYGADGAGNVGNIMEMTLAAIIPPLSISILRFVMHGNLYVQYLRIRKSYKMKPARHLLESLHFALIF